jgi:hypothetical protein
LSHPSADFDAPTRRWRSTCIACVKRWPIAATSGAPGVAPAAALGNNPSTMRRLRRADALARHSASTMKTSSNTAIAIARARSLANGAAPSMPISGPPNHTSAPAA